LCIHRDSRSPHRLCARERLLRDRGRPSPHVPVNIRHVVDGRVVVDDGGVVDVTHDGRVHRRVGHINAIYITLTDPV
jgi:hypothetical protein